MPGAFASTISGFATGDTIDLLKTAATAAILQPDDKLVVSNGGSIVATLQLSGNYAGDTFSVASDGSGGTNLTVAPGGAAAPLAQSLAAFAPAASSAARLSTPTEWHPHSMLAARLE